MKTVLELSRVLNGSDEEAVERYAAAAAVAILAIRESRSTLRVVDMTRNKNGRVQQVILTDGAGLRVEMHINTNPERLIVAPRIGSAVDLAANAYCRYTEEDDAEDPTYTVGVWSDSIREVLSTLKAVVFDRLR